MTSASAARTPAARPSAATPRPRRPDAETGDRHRRLVGIYGERETFYREQEATLAATMEDRAEWERVTEHGRRLAVAADAELRRRHPEQEIEPLRSAEPEPVSEAEHDELVPQAGDTVPETPQWVSRLKDRQPFREKLDERKAVRVPAEDHEMEDEGEAWPVWREQKEAILQPPKPEIPASPRVLEHVADREAEPG